GPAGYIRTAYAYAPFGAVSASGDVTQPFQWSSEVYDSELDLVYYNYRHYSPSLGRFLSRDPIEEQGGLNLYAFVGNNSCKNDSLGASRITNILYYYYTLKALKNASPLHYLTFPYFIPADPIVIDDVNGETHKELKSQIKDIVEKRDDMAVGFHEKVWRNINLASLNGGAFYLQEKGLAYAVNASSKVLASGKYSFCRIRGGKIRNLQGEISISWYDEMDANGWLEFYNKEIKGNENRNKLVAQWLLEGFVDLIGDGVLDANFNFIIKSKVRLDYAF
ncbi:MAG: RHS repeat-associated core domain-containing protein, partial [Opitutales bacterium]|nr:RHS repeat-associated core domain-containing protein [Opitutales bacterium]